MPTKSAVRTLALAGLGLALVLGGCGRLDAGAAAAPPTYEAPTTARPSPNADDARPTAEPSAQLTAEPEPSREPSAEPEPSKEPAAEPEPGTGPAPAADPIAEPDLDAIERLLDDLGGALTNARTDLTDEGGLQ